ncbi:MAG: hypothetical protein AB8G95_15390 [Anaerolineae bacterium]
MINHRKHTVQILTFLTLFTVLGFVFFSGQLPVVYAGVTPTPTSPPPDTPVPPPPTETPIPPTATPIPPDDTPTPVPPPEDTPVPPPGDTPVPPPGDTPTPMPPGTIPPQDIPGLGNGTPFSIVVSVLLILVLTCALGIYLLILGMRSIIKNRN